MTSSLQVLIPYKCKYCRHTFSCFERYRRHRLRHKRILPMSFSVLSVVSRTRNLCSGEKYKLKGSEYGETIIADRQEYVKQEIATKKLFQCSMCSRSFERENGLRTHANRVHQYQCTVCGQTFKNNNKGARAYIIHCRTHLKQNPKLHKCKVCQYTSKIEDKVHRHEQKYHKLYSRLHRCDVCGLYFPKKQDFEKHCTFHPQKALHYRSQIHPNPKIHKCTVCPLTFINEKTVRRHEQGTHKLHRVLHRCDVCGSNFPKKQDFEEHYKCYHPEDYEKAFPYRCPRCQKRFDSKSRLACHRRTHGKGKLHSGGKPSHRCKVCGKDCSSPSYLTRHIRSHTGEKPYECNICGSAYAYMSYLTRHIRLHTGEKAHKCPVCGKCFSDRGALKTHSVIHTRTHDQPFECTVCGKRFAQKNTFNRHSAMHKDPKSHQCSVCGKTFHSKGYLKSHSALHTDEKAYQCVKCGTCLASKKHLAQHCKVVHAGNASTDHLCSVCGKHFSCKTSLDRHYKIHVDVKPSLEHAGENPGQNTHDDKPVMENAHQTPPVHSEKPKKDHLCSVCGKCYRTKCELVTHFRVHSGEKPFKCTVCGKGFTRKGALNWHSSPQEKAYLCTVCGKRFAKESCLTEHTRIHTGEKPIQCSFCDKRFARKSGLRSHIKLHMVKEYECSKCGKQFVHKSNLKYHCKVNNCEKKT